MCRKYTPLLLPCFLFCFLSAFFFQPRDSLLLGNHFATRLYSHSIAIIITLHDAPSVLHLPCGNSSENGLSYSIPFLLPLLSDQSFREDWTCWSERDNAVRYREEWFCSMKLSANCKPVSRIPIAIPTNQIAMHAPISFCPVDRCESCLSAFSSHFSWHSKKG